MRKRSSWKLLVFCPFMVACGPDSVADLSLEDNEVPEVLESELTSGGLKAAYFNDGNFRDLAVTRVDPVINFVLSDDNPPAAGVDGQSFSVRWQGLVQPKFSETYTFTTRANDRVRLFVNGERITESNSNRITEDSGQVTLVAGMPVSIALEYSGQPGDKTVKLFWESTSQPKQIIPSAALFPDETIPVPYVARNIGADNQRVDNADAQYDAQMFKLTSRGQGVGNRRDELLFVFQPLGDEADISARVNPPAAGTTFERAGVMIRASVASDAAMAAVLVDAEGRIVFQRRQVAGGDVRTTQGPRMAPPVFLKIAREGGERNPNRVRALVSQDGVAWQTFARDDIALGALALYGMASSSNNNAGASTVTMDKVAAVRPYLFLMRDGIGTEQTGNEYYANIGAPFGLTLDDWIRQFMGNQRTRSAYYRNAVDLGFWREMNCTEVVEKGRGGCWVRNWEDEEDRFNGSNDLGTVTMNISEQGFVRFYVFDPDGVLSPVAILDSEQAKLAPALCTVCHGGSFAPGQTDLGSVFREFEPAMLQRRSGISQAQAEREWFVLNEIIRKANQALRSQAEGGPAGIDNLKKAMEAYVPSIYQSTDPVVSYDVTDPAHIPASWKLAVNPVMQAAQNEIYTQLVSPYCMGCHRISPIDFTSYPVFQGLSAKVGGEAYINKIMFDLPDDPRRIETAVMPQAELMVEGVRRNQRALQALDRWLVQAANPAEAQSKVQFEVTNVPNVAEGQTVKVIGNVAPLGAQTPANALTLIRAGNGTFRASVPLSQGATVTFRFAVVQGDQVVQMESQDRTLTVPTTLEARNSYRYQPYGWMLPSGDALGLHVRRIERMSTERRRVTDDEQFTWPA